MARKMSQERIEAFAKNIKRYPSVIPCKYGHIGDRYLRSGNCVTCHNEQNKTYLRLQTTRYARQGRHNRYGLSVDVYTMRLFEQDCKCLICKLPETRIDKRTGSTCSLSIDHCHKTKNIRGLLCHKCNVAIGLLKDDVNNVFRAYKYLEKYSL